VSEIEARARPIVTRLRTSGMRVSVEESTASVGGGAFPTAAIASRAIVLSQNAQDAEKSLRLGDPAVIGRLSEGNLLLDMRTVLPSEDDLLADAIMKLRHD
jgi:L-seryl-tRNA(Ser) seleniumtransferase